MRWLFLFLVITQVWAAKPQLQLFLGDERCPWSQKLQQEVLDHPDFIGLTQETFIVVPMKTDSDVKELPMIVIATSEGEEMARVGYLLRSPADFAHYLKQLWAVCEKIVASKFSDMNIEELKSIYGEKAFSPWVKEKVFAIGLEKDEGTFFLLERYGELLKKQSKKAKRVRQEIEERDPDNREDTFFHLAVLDFQDRAERKEKIDKTVKPLRSYLSRFKADWRVHMLMTQFFFAKEKMKEALKEAKIAWQLAPQEAKDDIDETMRHIQDRIL